MLTPLRLGQHDIYPLMLAPMAGITDRVFRDLCRRFGAGYAVAEMTHSKPELVGRRKSATRGVDPHEAAPRVVQLLGYDPRQLAEAARHYTEAGADIIDLNLGCPAKKVCRVAAGSALMGDPARVRAIFEAMRAATHLPLTVKMRTGPDDTRRNAPELAWLAQECGFDMVVIHGRTRAQRFEGEAEYDTIAEACRRVSIPVIANGDLRSAGQIRRVLDHTGARGVMIGRAALGTPWLFARLRAALEGRPLPLIDRNVQLRTIQAHVRGLHDLYGPLTGLRMARKHFGWYAAHLPDGDALRRAFNRLEQAEAQHAFIEELAS
ncbi:tRNA dihydrouridine synthase DusB [Sulfurivirga sp.]|uniref:tRNA dihydrouridine synthase DusB n=1 Tax=Sulfurivirga sp. TaxID=2614236 RepID=UPI0025D88782|nr:tRNA dihydrouridine synthase DusB [Sulfurivirga sp.]